MMAIINLLNQLGKICHFRLYFFTYYADEASFLILIGYLYLFLK